jgi:hypothetical protein
MEVSEGRRAEKVMEVRKVRVSRLVRQVKVVEEVRVPSGKDDQEGQVCQRSGGGQEGQGL